MRNPVTNPVAVTDERAFEGSLRPVNLLDFQGQVKLKRRLKVFIDAAQMRQDVLDHVLLCGPPGLGKTTLAWVLSREMQANIVVSSGPVLARPGDLVGLLTSLGKGDILFVDEIHRLAPAVEEYLYAAMEDYCVDVVVDRGPGARSVRLDLPRFTLVGATTRSGLLTSPMRARFGMTLRLDYYAAAEIVDVIVRSARVLDVEVDDNASMEIALRSRGTPRVANRLLRRVRDYAQVHGQGCITKEVACSALEMLEVDERGLDEMDRKVLLTIIDKFDGGPVGIHTIAAAVAEEPDTIEDVHEPFLVQEGFLNRTRRGREATRHAYEHLGRALNPRLNQADLFGA